MRLSNAGLQAGVEGGTLNGGKGSTSKMQNMSNSFPLSHIFQRNYQVVYFKTKGPQLPRPDQKRQMHTHQGPWLVWLLEQRQAKVKGSQGNSKPPLLRLRAQDRFSSTQRTLRCKDLMPRAQPVPCQGSAPGGRYHH